MATEPLPVLEVDLFDSLASVVPDCLLLVDSTGRVTSASASAVALLRTSRRAITGRPLAQALRAAPDQIDRLLERCRPEGQRATAVIVSHDRSGARGLICECLPAGGGGLLIRIRQEAAGPDLSPEATAASHWYREIGREASDLITRHAPDGTYLWASPSARRILGYEPEELVGTNAYAHFHPDDAATIAEGSHDVVLAGPDVVTTTYRIRRKDGVYIWLETTSQAVRDLDTGEVVHIIALSRDVSARKEVEDELRRLNAELEQFVAIASHDLRNPLAAAVGFMDLVRRDFAGDIPSDALLMLDRADAALTHMDDLLRDLLTYSRSAGTHLEREPVDLDALVHDVVRARRGEGRSEGGGVALGVDIGDLPVVNADRTGMRQVFENLVDNAVKYARRGVPPHIHITAERTDDEGWRFDVVDNGAGVPPEQRERVFGMFNRGPWSGDQPGTGVGLAIVAKVVSRHGGRVWVDDPPGGQEGSRFSFTLPDAPA